MQFYKVEIEARLWEANYTRLQKKPIMIILITENAASSRPCLKKKKTRLIPE